MHLDGHRLFAHDRVEVRFGADGGEVRSGGCRALEPERTLSQADRVTVGEHLPLDAHAVDERAVRRPKVLDPEPAPRLPLEARVRARDSIVSQHDVARGGPAEEGVIRLQHEIAPVAGRVEYRSEE